MLTGYLGLAGSLGLDGAQLMRDAGLNPDDLFVPDQWVPAASVARLLDATATEAGQEDFGVRLAERRQLSTLGPLSLVLREEPDLRSVLSLMMRYEYAYNEAMRMGIDESDGLATIRMWLEFGEPAPEAQALGLGVAALHGILLQCAGPQWQAVAVCFQSPAPADLDAVRRMLGDELHFDHEFTGIVLRVSDLDTTNVLADPLLRPYAQQYLAAVVSPRAPTTTHQVRELVEFFMPLGKCTLANVALALDLDRRTLQRHLTSEGESFTSILHASRADFAKHYLAADRYSMTDISARLGFDSPSAFHLWFEQQFGVSPGKWRETATAASPASTPDQGLPHHPQEPGTPLNGPTTREVIQPP
ncbi:MAG: AraC family transcriptional regulator [Ornithinibacter sp.]